jgi:adenylate kinase family enzyme
MCTQAGFPRTREQAQLLHTLDPVSAVIELVVPFDVIVERLAHRWIHAPSGRIYNLEYNPPKTPVCACARPELKKMCRVWMM